MSEVPIPPEKVCVSVRVHVCPSPRTACSKAQSISPPHHSGESKWEAPSERQGHSQTSLLFPGEQIENHLPKTILGFELVSLITPQSWYRLGVLPLTYFLKLLLKSFEIKTFQIQSFLFLILFLDFVAKVGLNFLTSSPYSKVIFVS